MSLMKWLRRLRSERGQVIILFVGIITIIFAMAAIVIDWGLWASERRGVQRAADFAALAGSQDLLTDANSGADEQAAIDSALQWAARNGYANGVDGVTVEVELLCQNHVASPPPGVCLNTNPSGPAHCNLDGDCDGIRVVIRKPATHLFSSIFGIGGMHVGYGSAAGLSFDVIPLDTVMVLDRTISMTGSPLDEAKKAAKKFTGVLLPEGGSASQTQVGMVPYSNCYNPPYSSSYCTPTSMVVPLTNNKSTVEHGIDLVTANGSTNICLGLYKGNETILPSGPDGTDTRRIVVLLSDGQNNYMEGADGTSTLPPLACQPITDPSHGDPYPSACHAAEPRERELDVKTKTLVDQMKANGVEFYIVGFGVCGTANSNLCNPALIGDANTSHPATHDNTANRNFLKCLASSKDGTNDHYFEVPHASDLPQVFQIIAWKIAGRALTE